MKKFFLIFLPLSAFSAEQVDVINGFATESTASDIKYNTSFIQDILGQVNGISSSVGSLDNSVTGYIKPWTQNIKTDVHSIQSDVYSMEGYLNTVKTDIKAFRDKFYDWSFGFDWAFQAYTNSCQFQSKYIRDFCESYTNDLFAYVSAPVERSAFRQVAPILISPPVSGNNNFNNSTPSAYTVNFFNGVVKGQGVVDMLADYFSMQGQVQSWMFRYFSSYHTQLQDVRRLLDELTTSVGDLDLNPTINVAPPSVNVNVQPPQVVVNVTVTNTNSTSDFTIGSDSIAPVITPTFDLSRPFRSFNIQNMARMHIPQVQGSFEECLLTLTSYLYVQQNTASYLQACILTNLQVLANQNVEESDPSADSELQSVSSSVASLRDSINLDNFSMPDLPNNYDLTDAYSFFSNISLPHYVSIDFSSAFDGSLSFINWTDESSASWIIDVSPYYWFFRFMRACSIVLAVSFFLALYFYFFRFLLKSLKFLSDVLSNAFSAA